MLSVCKCFHDVYACLIYKCVACVPLWLKGIAHLLLPKFFLIIISLLSFAFFVYIFSYFLLCEVSDDELLVDDTLRKLDRMDPIVDAGMQ